MKESIFEGVALIAESVLGCKVNEDSNVDNTDNWDSFATIQLVLAIEQAFKTRFSEEELRLFTSIRAISEMIEFRES